jgi:hypothetical protein
LLVAAAVGDGLGWFEQAASRNSGGTLSPNRSTPRRVSSVTGKASLDQQVSCRA